MQSTIKLLLVPGVVLCGLASPAPAALLDAPGDHTDGPTLDRPSNPIARDGRSDWVVVNGGQYIDAGESLDPERAGYFSSVVIAPPGEPRNLIYMFHSSRLGTVMGRYREDLVHTTKS
jgi:hypothetical protein